MWLLLLTGSASAQVGETRDSLVKSYNLCKGCSGIKWDISDAGLQYFTYSDSEGNTRTHYFNQHNLCVTTWVLYTSTEDMPKITDEMNKKYVLLSANKWMESLGIECYVEWTMSVKGEGAGRFLFVKGTLKPYKKD